MGRFMENVEICRVVRRAIAFAGPTFRNRVAFCDAKAAVLSQRERRTERRKRERGLRVRHTILHK
jgi:hypothetical protein